MTRASNMLRASDLKVGDKITCKDSKDYLVIYNRNELPVRRLILREVNSVHNITLFYDYDAEYAKNTFGIDLLGWHTMIRASDLKVGDKIISTTGIEYEVIENHVGDVLFILNENGEAGHIYNGLHLFYDDIDYLDYAKDILNIDLSLA